jgi:RNA polymerase sigma factor (sigma-70 family)
VTPEEWFGKLFTAHYGDVLVYAIRRCRSYDEAEDIAAETFAIAWRRIGEVPEGEAARAWLFRTAYLVHLNYQRARQRRWSILERLRARLPGLTSPGPEGQVAEEDLVHRTLGLLNPRDREVLRLYAWEEFAASEIAVILGISTPAVWKRLQRCRDRLAEILASGSPPVGAVSTRSINLAERKAMP